MNDEQRKAVDLLATGEFMEHPIGKAAPAIQALAQVVLELAAKAKAAEPQPGLGMGASALAAAAAQPPDFANTGAMNVSAARDRQYYGESLLESRLREEEKTNAKLRAALDSAALQTPVSDWTMFERLVESVLDSPALAAWRTTENRRQYARRLVLELLSVLDDDPGHDVTADVVPVCADRDPSPCFLCGEREGCRHRRWG